MCKKEKFGCVITRTNVNIIHNHFFLCDKRLLSYFASQLVAMILCIVLGFIATTLAANATHNEEGAATHSSAKYFRPYDYLKQHADFPVDFLFSVYHATSDFQQKWPETAHPLFSTLGYKKKVNSGQQYLDCSTKASDLNCFVDYSNGIKYIDRKQLIPISDTALYSLLLEEYGTIYYKDNHDTASLTITIAGMLFDLKRREESGDAVAALVSKFLKRSYVKTAFPASTNNQFFLSRWIINPLKKLFASPEELSFSAQLATLKDSLHPDSQSKFKRFWELKGEGYQYQDDYTFTSYEIDETGDIITTSFDNIVQPDKEVENVLSDHYSELIKSANHTHSSASPAFSGMAGVKVTDSFVKKTCGVAFAGICLFSMINSGLTLATPPRCTEGNCHTQNHYSLFNHNFTTALQSDPSGYFKLAEDITLGTQQNLPISLNCRAPFSGILETGNYTLHAGNGTSPIFGCMDYARVSGNLDVCAADSTHDNPVIANHLFSKNVVNIKQADNCDTQHPVFGNVRGSHNQIVFTGTSKEMRSVGKTGIVANIVSGNDNKIIEKEGRVANAPLVVIAGGNGNTYQQENMNITRLAKHHPPDSKTLVADYFAGNNTHIIQHNVNATFTTSDVYIPDNSRPDIDGGIITTFSSNTFITDFPLENAIRVTNISDGSAPTIVTNNGRAQVFRDGAWQTICEDTLTQKEANVACRSMGFQRAEREGQRIRLKNTLSPVKLSSTPVHIGRKCTGYEQDLSQCSVKNTTNTTIVACLQNGEAFLSCSNETQGISPSLSTRLTDFNSGDTERLDTTNMRQGRLEQQNLSGELSTVCATGFNNRSASVACNSMGYNGGYVTSVRAAPVSAHTPILAFNWGCKGNEHSLFDCPYRKITCDSCTHHDDVTIRCYGYTNSYLTRLTDRHSVDHYSTDTSNTGFGRLEIAYPDTNIFITFCTNLPNVRGTKIDDAVAKVACRQIGFHNGTLSYLSAGQKSNTSDIYKTGAVFCSGSENIPHECQISHVSDSTRCEYPGMDAVVLCNNGTTERPQVSLKRCLRTDYTPETDVFFAGEFNLQTSGCPVTKCPVKYWDSDGVKDSDFLQRWCNGTQRLYTTNSDDWMKVWSIRCKNRADDCSCHLPNEQLLGLVYQDDNPHEALLVSRQNYLYNENANARGLVQISKLFSNEAPQLLRPENKTLPVGVTPVNQIITEQHLLGLYSDAEEGSAQLFWSPLKESNGVYHTNIFPVEGKPLLLTSKSVFVKDVDNELITRYALNTTTGDDHTKAFSIDNISSETITFPVNATDISTAAIKNGWLYVATTNDIDASQIHVTRYNTETKQWDYALQQAYYIDFDENTNYKMIIDDEDAVQFLSPGELLLHHTVLVSIPDSGGCVSLTNKSMPETTEVPETTEQPDPYITNQCDEQSVNAPAIAGTFLGVFFGSSVLSCGCNYYYYSKKHNLSCQLTKRKKDDSTTIKAGKEAEPYEIARCSSPVKHTEAEPYEIARCSSPKHTYETIPYHEYDNKVLHESLHDDVYDSSDNHMKNICETDV